MLELTRALNSADAAARRGGAARNIGRDLGVVLGVFAILAVMIFPLSPLAIDILVCLNISIGIVIVLSVIYVRTPVEFSVFPTVLLLTTLFRLAVSVATTRLILVEGEGGQIIHAFGSMVVGGSVLVGLVIFAILTIVQFLVVAKGAERVAEVGARFTLDALPGKQLSIDSDLRAGLIDRDEARRRRRNLELETRLHGSLDGAMKYVKGDAIAGIIIIAVNLLAGLAVGVLQHGLPLGQAVETYSVLTVGDGLVTQAPALLGAFAAGLLVTRTTDEEKDRHLGDAIHRQFGAYPRVFLVAGTLVLVMAATPGFPHLVFAVIGAGLLGLGLWLTPASRAAVLERLQPLFGRWLAPKTPPAAVAHIEGRGWSKMHPLVVELLGAAAPAELENVRAALDEEMERFQHRLGLAMPRISIRVQQEAAAPLRWRVLVYEALVAEGAPLAGEARLETLKSGLAQAICRSIGAFVGIQEAAALLNAAAADLPDLVKETLRVMPIGRVADLMRRLAEEQVSLRNVRELLEALVEAGHREKDVAAQVELVRAAMRRSLFHAIAPSNQLRVVTVSAELDQQLRAHLHNQTLALEMGVARALLERVGAAVGRLHPDALLCSVAVRRALRGLIESQHFSLPVVSFLELPTSHRLEILEVLDLEA